MGCRSVAFYNARIVQHPFSDFITRQNCLSHRKNPEFMGSAPSLLPTPYSCEI
ncbi:MAG: hypothetical protein F6K55_16590 [Moorea sp. SIO4A3]|nr:hypothetical protein [Moorena sp. SIO4A3]